MIKRLKTNRVMLLQQPEKNALILHVSHNYNYSKEERTNSTQARICTLDYTATLAIDDFYGNHILEPTTVTVSHSIILQPNEVFESTSQITIVKNELKEELLNKIFNILISSKTESVTQHWAHEN
jgi:outer membrane lipopolysaccharide assembly protein LptE/RlpB